MAGESEASRVRVALGVAQHQVGAARLELAERSRTVGSLDHDRDEMFEPFPKEVRGEVEQLAVKAFGEMIARHDATAVAAYKGIGALFSRRYRVDVDHGALKRLRELDREHSLLWLPSHRSYLDMFYLEQVAQEAGIRPAFVLGGDNLDFWPIGPILRRAGVLYIRRDTHDAPIYRFALRSYLGYIVSSGQNLTWSIEGGRSRTGKLRPPRYGALRYVVDAVRNTEGPDAMVVPVSVVYEQLAEVAAMTAEGRPATMPEKMISDMPLPTPRSVICSPSHIRNIVPVTSVTAVVRMKPVPGLSTTF